MLYGVKIRNVQSKSKNIYEDKIVFFDSRENAKQFERDIRFLDDIAYRDDYKKKMLAICSKYQALFAKDTGDEIIEMINQYPIAVEFFDC